MLRKLRIAGSSRHEVAVSSKSRTIKKFAAFLQKARSQAMCLYSAISSGWAPGCHPEHIVGLFLDGRHAPLQKKRLRIGFYISSDCGAVKDEFWPKIEVEINEDDDDVELPATS